MHNCNINFQRTAKHCNFYLHNWQQQHQIVPKAERNSDFYIFSISLFFREVQKIMKFSTIKAQVRKSKCTKNGGSRMQKMFKFVCRTTLTK